MRFTPALPEKIEAAAGLPLGLADKVWLALEAAEEFPAETRVFGRTDRTETGAYHVRPFGRPVIEAYFGGRLARRLEEEGGRAAAAFAIEELAGQLGSGIRARPSRGSGGSCATGRGKAVFCRRGLFGRQFLHRPRGL